ncbi:MAG TPA: PASTA domain-containing protein [Caulobacteraceae bacterium]|nr:PASTA domain-containing protein [Caulobacteraceae bacterium]
MSTEPGDLNKAGQEEARIPVSARIPTDPLPVTGRLPTGPEPIWRVPPVSPPAPATFDFSVASMTVNNPRAPFDDTDYATLAINVLAADNTVIQQYGPVVRSLGNLSKHQSIDPEMSLTGITVPDGGSMAVAFVVMNKGGWSWDSDVINALELAGSAVLGALAQGSIAGATTTTVAADGTVTVAPTLIPLSTVLEIAAGLVIVLEGINILFADCDGTVVPGVMTIGKTELLQLATPGPWNMTFEYPGTDSAIGCGANSDYSVTYSVEATPQPVAVPDVTGMSIDDGAKALAAVGLIAVEKVTRFALKLEPKILGQSPPAGSLALPKTQVQCDVAGPPVIPPPPKGHQIP